MYTKVLKIGNLSILNNACFSTLPFENYILKCTKDYINSQQGTNQTFIYLSKFITLTAWVTKNQHF